MLRAITRSLLVACLLLTGLFSLAHADDTLEINVVSHDTIDLVFDIAGGDPAFVRYLLIRNDTVSNVQVWSGSEGQVYVLRDTGLTFRRRYTYTLHHQVMLPNQTTWTTINTVGPVEGYPGRIKGRLIADDIIWDARTDYEISIFEVPETYTLTMNEDVIVRLLPVTGRLDVRGSLIVKGTKALPVTIASGTSGSRWSAINLYGTAFADFNYARVSDGGGQIITNWATMNVYDQSRVNVRNSTFRTCRKPIYLQSNATSQIRSSTFERGQESAIHVKPPCNWPELSNLAATGNTKFNGVEVEFGLVERTWNLNNSLPILLHGLIIQDKWAVLVGENTIIWMQDQAARIELEGTLQCNGTAARPVEFKPLVPDQGWASIVMTNEATADFTYTYFNKGGAWPDTDNTTIRVNDIARLRAVNCQFTECSKPIIIDSETLCTIRNTTFRMNQNWPVTVFGNRPFPLAGGNTAIDNGEFNGFWYFGNGRAVDDNVRVQTDMPVMFTELLVGPSGRLTIDAGTRLIAQRPFDSIDVQGGFAMLGTPDSPVRFDEIPGEREGWGAIRASGDADLNLSWTEFENGGRDPDREGTALLLVERAKAHVKDCLFTGNGNETAVKATQNADLRLDRCTFRDNDRAAVKIGLQTGRQALIAECLFTEEEEALVILQGTVAVGNSEFLNNRMAVVSTNTEYLNEFENCRFQNNSQWAINNANGPENILAANCWWGSTTGPTHSSNPGGSGDMVSDYVLFEPWSEETPTPTPTQTPTPSPTPTNTPSPDPSQPITPTSTPTRTPTPTPPPNARPSIMLAGYWNTNLTGGRSGTLQMVAMVTDPNGVRDIERVDIAFEGLNYLQMRDDAVGGDLTSRGDGVYGYRVVIGPGSFPVKMLLTIRAQDKGFLTAPEWPYLNVE